MWGAGSRSMKSLFKKTKGQNNCLISVYFPVTAAVVCFLILFPLFITNCDTFGGESVEDFINYNTGEAAGASWKVTTPVYKSSQKGDDWLMHFPDLSSPDYGQQDPNAIQIEVKINNPYKYDLDVTPVIHEYIGPDGIPRDSAAAAAEGKKIELITPIANTVTARISGANQGDAFRIRFDLKTKDGTRVFPSYYIKPLIIHDSRLMPAADLKVGGDSVQAFAIWNIPQNNDAHKGINTIILTFISADGSNTKGPWEYHKETSGIWSTNDPTAAGYTEITPTGSDKLNFSIKFPATPGDFQEFLATYSFKVELKDKNKVSAVADSDGFDERADVNLEIQYRIRKPDNSFEYRSFGSAGFKKILDKSSYNFIIPYEVGGLKFKATKQSEYQRIVFGAIEQNEIDYGIYWIGAPPGAPDPITMTIFWVDPESGTETPFVYKFFVFRLSADKESALKGLSFSNTAGNVIYSPTPGFDWDTDNYKVYVPSNAGNMYIKAKYLSTATINGPAGKLPISDLDTTDQITDIKYKGVCINNADMILKINPPGEGDWCFRSDTETIWEYHGISWANTGFKIENPILIPWEYADYKNLKIRECIWNFTPLSEGENFFSISVQPQDGEEAKRIYNITVVKATTDPYAKLASLGITANGTPLILEPGFNPNNTNYTVNVPNNLLSSLEVKLSAEVENPATSFAKITQIISDPAPHPSYNPNQETISNLTIIGGSLGSTLSSGNSKLITIKVVGGTNNSSSRNYTVRVNGNLPAVSGTPQLTGGDKSLTVSWSTVSGATGYDVSCDLNTVTDPFLAANCITNISSTSTTILDLFNSEEYNVWVRQRRKVSNIDYVGDWKPAQTTPKTGSPYNYGKPGSAAGVKTLVTTPVNIGFVPATTTYYADIRSEIESVKANITADTANIITVNGVTYSANHELTLPGSSGGASYPNIIKAASRDGTTDVTYTINVRRMFNQPGNLSLIPKSNSIDVSWNTFGSGFIYEVYYSKTDNFSTAAVWKLDLTSPSTSITNLDADATYYVWVRCKRIADGLLGEEVKNTASTQNFPFIITVTGGPPGELTFWEPTTIGPYSWTDGYTGSQDEFIQLTVNHPNASTCKWYIDNNKAGDGSTLKVRVRSYSVAVHKVTVSIVINNTLYSNNFQFQITQ